MQLALGIVALFVGLFAVVFAACWLIQTPIASYPVQ